MLKKWAYPKIITNYSLKDRVQVFYQRDPNLQIEQSKLKAYQKLKGCSKKRSTQMWNKLHSFCRNHLFFPSEKRSSCAGGLYFIKPINNLGSKRGNFFFIIVFLWMGLFIFLKANEINNLKLAAANGLLLMAFAMLKP